MQFRNLLLVILAVILTIGGKVSAQGQNSGNVTFGDVTNILSQLTWDDIKREWNNPNSFPGCRSQIIPKTQSTYILTDMPTGVQILVGAGQREGGINIFGGNGPVVCAKTRNNIPVPVSPIYRNGYGEYYVQIFTPTRAGTVNVFLKINGNIASVQSGTSKSQQVRIERIR